eukprot:COSAG01_NODE_72802_length_252_cov_0.620915_1_plen_59_part_01
MSGHVGCVSTSYCLSRLSSCSSVCIHPHPVACDRQVQDAPELSQFLIPVGEGESVRPVA